MLAISAQNVLQGTVAFRYTRMDAEVNTRSATIRLSDVVVHAPPLAASEVHTSLGNIKLSRKYGMPPHLCQHDGKAVRVKIGQVQ